jgi:pyruvyltransferase
MNDFRNTKAWTMAKRLGVDALRRNAASFTSWDKIPLMWCEGRNWGDALSPYLVRLLSGKEVVLRTGLHQRRFLAIGSILGDANEYSEVWGSGFIHENDRVLGGPRMVHAVRGPLTRDLLLRQGVDCPEAYGDPALLLSMFFNPEVVKRYAVGIIPHYIDKGNPWLRQFVQDPQVRIIDIEAGIEDFVREVKSCEVILSSSLHGLICADSYGVPNAWIQLSGDVVGGDFKFRDYRASIGAVEPIALTIKESSRLGAMVSKAVGHVLNIDLRKLQLVCPFLSTPIRRKLDEAPAHSFGLPYRLKSVNLEARAIVV